MRFAIRPVPVALVLYLVLFPTSGLAGTPAALRTAEDGELSPRVEPSSEDVDSPTLASYRRGLDLVRSGLAAMGGLAALEEAGGIELLGAGTLDLTSMMQGGHPDREELVPVEEGLAVDLREHRVGWETHARVNPDAEEWIRYLHDAEGRMLIVLRQSDQAFWVPGDVDQKRRYERIVPHLLLRDALARRESLRHLGTVDGREAVSFTLATGESITLLFDVETGLLRGFEYLVDLPLHGDTPIRWRLDEYREIEGLGRYPGGYRIDRGNRVLKRVRYETIRAGVTESSLLAVPEGIEIPAPPSAPTAGGGQQTGPPAEPTLPEVRTLADGVYLAVGVRSSFHVLFVDTGGGILVVDTPAGYHELQMVPAIDWAGDVTSSSVGRRLLDAIRATVPGKPVRWVVLTHHHGDHAGGIRPFLAEGATVVTSATTKPVVEHAARATFTLAEDELTGEEGSPRIEVVEGERTIEGSERSVRVLDVGPNPHAEGMLVVYLPGERILYQSDLFMPSGGGFPDPARIPVMRWFVDWLDESGLEPDRIYAIHGSAQVTEEQIQAIRALR